MLCMKITRAGEERCKIASSYFFLGGGCLTKEKEKGGFLNCSNFRLSLEIKHYNI